MLIWEKYPDLELAAEKKFLVLQEIRGVAVPNEIAKRRLNLESSPLTPLHKFFFGGVSEAWIFKVTC